jgi:hypothetical protein
MAPTDRAAARGSGIPGKALAILYLIAAVVPLLAAWAAGRHSRALICPCGLDFGRGRCQF